MSRRDTSVPRTRSSRSCATGSGCSLMWVLRTTPHQSPPRGGRRRVALIVLGLACAVLGAGPAPAQESSPPRLRAALGELDRLAAQALQRSGVPGMAIAVVHEDAVVYLKGFGVREAG